MTEVGLPEREDVTVEEPTPDAEPEIGDAETTPDDPEPETETGGEDE